MSESGRNQINVTISEEFQRRLDAAFPEALEPSEQLRAAAGEGVHRRLAELCGGDGGLPGDGE